MRERAPLIVGVGGTPRAGSSTNAALRAVLSAVRDAGGQTIAFHGEFLARLPLYDPGSSVRTTEARALLAAVREADALVLATPGYHGGISGLLKNAVDLLEDLRNDERPYLDGVAVGCVVTAFGAQGGVTTLHALRAVVHSLRGWPTPLGLTLNTTTPIFDDAGACRDEHIARQIEVLARQLVDFRAPAAPAHSSRPGTDTSSSVRGVAHCD